MIVAPPNERLPVYAQPARQERDVCIPALHQLATGSLPSASLRRYGFRERVQGAGGVPIVLEWPVGTEHDLDRFLDALDRRRETRRSACWRCGA